MENMDQAAPVENTVPNETPAIVAPSKPVKSPWKNVAIIVLAVLLVAVSVVAVMGWTRPTKSALEAIQDGIRKERSSTNVSRAMQGVRIAIATFTAESGKGSVSVFSENDDDFVVVLAWADTELPAYREESMSLVDKVYKLLTVNPPFDDDITIVLLDIDTGEEVYRLVNGVPQ